VAQQLFQENISTATFSSFSSILYQLLITSPNWKQAAKPLHIEQHRNSLSPMGKKGISLSMIKLKMQTKLCKTNDRHFPKIPFTNENLNKD
jgi:hypothetical protein